MKECLVFTTRPNGEPLWLPEGIAAMLNLSHAARLTPDQFNHSEVQSLIAIRLRNSKAAKEQEASF